MALTICPTSTWQRNATVAAGDQSGLPGSTSSMLRTPTDVYIDRNNSAIYVLDSGNYRVQRIPVNSGTGTTIISSTNGTGINQFLSMEAMNVDNDGYIYILDGRNGRVTKWRPGIFNGTLVAGGNGLGNNANQLDWPTGMFVDPSTLVIWIADTNNHRIVKWLSSTTSIVVCGSYGRGDHQFMYPSGLFVDTSDSNTLYIADKNNHRIQMWSSTATSGTTVAGITAYYGEGHNQLWYPQAVVVDTDRNMYIIDGQNRRIMRWMIGASSGVSIGQTITFTTQSVQLWIPKNINFDSNGSLFVTDTQNNRIQKLAISCPVAANVSTTTVPSVTTTPSNSDASCSTLRWHPNATTVAGSPVGEHDNTPTTLYFPSDVFVDENDTFYVLDALNFRVQLFRPPSLIGATVVNISYSRRVPSPSPIMLAVSVDIRGNIYILETDNHRVMKSTAGAMNAIIVAGGNGNGVSARQLNNPYGMFIDSKFIIWIADTGNNRIVRWENASTGIIVCGSYGTEANQFNQPSGIFVDTHDGNTFYVVDTGNHRIQMWTEGATSGITVVGQTGVCGNQLDQLCGPSAVTGDINGNLFIIDGYNSRIVLWVKKSKAVTSTTGIFGNGVLPNQLVGPGSVKLDSSGALIVADAGNNRIQKLRVLCYGRTTSGGLSSVLFYERSELFFKIFAMIIFIFQV